MLEQFDEPIHIGRPCVLDEKKRRQIIALLANGSSRRIAARVVGCDSSTIARTAQRDPDFAARLAAAEARVEIEAIRNIRDAAKNTRYWRAAAWLLERKNPRDFARQTPTTLSEEDVVRMSMRLSQPAIYNMTDEEFDEYQDRVYDMIRALHESDELARFLPIPPPPKPIYVTRDNGDSPDPHPSEISENGTDPGDCPDDCLGEDGTEHADCPDLSPGENGTEPGDCPDFCPSKNGTVPCEAPSRDPSPESFTTPVCQEGDKPKEKPSPQPYDFEWLRAREAAANELGY